MKTSDSPDLDAQGAFFRPPNPPKGTVLDSANTEISSRSNREVGASAFVGGQARHPLSLAAAKVGTYMLDLSSERIHGDSQYFSLLGFPPTTRDLPLGAFLAKLDCEGCRSYQKVLEDVRQQLSDQLELCIFVHRNENDSVPVLDRGLVSIEDERVLIVGAQIDLTGLTTPLPQFQHLASHDQLTGLLSRHAIWRLVEQAHHQTQGTGSACAIAVLDIDHLKEVNDIHGPIVGDKLLSELATRLDQLFRPRQITMGRWGGDEFLAIASDLDELGLVREIDNARQALVDVPTLIDGTHVSVTFSSGVTSVCQPMDTTEQILARADVALYRAKRDGCNRVYGSGRATDNRTMSLAILVQDAVRTARVTPVFQPLVRLSDQRPVAEEAFSRIMEGGSRLLNAAAFIEVALQLKLLHRIDHMLFDAVIERITYPPSSASSPLPVNGEAKPIFVHISEDLIRHPATLNEMVKTLADHPLSAVTPVVLVLNEQIATEHTKTLPGILQPMLDLGCKLSISGFGDSDNSLQMLYEGFPVSFLSVDPSLVQEALKSERARKVIAEIQLTARELGITTIAKQLQNPETLKMVIELGLDWGQGYLLGVPTDPSWPLSARSGV
ncbi:sensor domain-containing diguanylate cyclase [Thiorhodovibrio frisius]|uniref:Diguanylate cyclase (GGDEF) domain-containing protein n=1 Tax=Thiorhodovibrio frisius TaxID=631362 RepID=H8Z3S7_9GAMM|nr:sensor domain-containing diguanylate cyclase [Thiorhodovibrio frisius]EIC21079.1 diguanylate cyclase (GGDEF) domain-containing protein [Thiorhodovibrio frisius]WPL22140.1 Bacteriophytochrome cph2 [Thiorhodovibrio frisius]